MHFVPLRYEPESHETPIEEQNSLEETKCLTLTLSEKKLLCQAWTALKRQKPELYLVLDARRKEWQLRGGSSQYNHEVSRGFYVRLAKRIGVTPQTICYRLKAAMEWLADWLKRNGQPK